MPLMSDKMLIIYYLKEGDTYGYKCIGESEKQVWCF